MFRNAFGAQVQGIRGPDSQVRSLKDVGNYDVWTSVVIDNNQAGELIGFSYGVGGGIAGRPAVNSTKLETNLRTPFQFVDESMNVYAVAIQIERLTISAVQPTGAPAGTAYTATLDDFRNIETHTRFSLHVGGDKPFAEGLVSWFPEAGGIYGMSNANNGEVLGLGTPTPAAARFWDAEYRLPIGRIEKFWCEFSWPHGAPAIDLFPEDQHHGAIMIKVRMMGARARAVQ